MRSGINTTNKDEEKLINNININLVVDEQSASFINNNSE